MRNIRYALPVLILALMVLCSFPGSFSIPRTCEESNNKECQEFLQSRLRKQQERNATFQQLESLFRKFQRTAGEENDIMNLPFDILVAKLQSRQLRATDVLAAYFNKALNVTKEFNCVTEFVPNAMAIAQELDNSPKVKGPLHGLPVCFKDNMDIKGMDSTLGYSRLLYKPAKVSALMVKTFQDLGAVPFCKTNVPQTMISAGSDNPIFGTTLNPLNKNLTPGGSTSGGACMVAAGALKVSTATDIGGSARIPAHYTGVSGMAFTPRRISTKGIVEALPNIVGLADQPGLIADKPSTIATIFKLFVQNNRQYNMDPLVVPLPWSSHLYESNTPLRIGYFTTLGFFSAIGDTPSTVLKAKEALESRGHKLISLEHRIDSFEAYDVYSDLLAADGGNHVLDMLQNDDVSPSFQNFNFLMSIPIWQRHLLSNILPLSERLKLTLGAGLDAYQSSGLWSRIGAKNTIRDSVLKMMEKNSLDLIISPVMPFPAPRTDIASHLFFATVYSSLWNLLQFPAGVVPFGIESGKNISFSSHDRDLILRLAKEGLSSSTGMPIGVQVIGKPYQDELVLRGMDELYELSNMAAPKPPRIPQAIDIRKMPKNLRFSSRNN